MTEKISKTQARSLWAQAQGLNTQTPFGKGAGAVPKAIEHLGYVQIDTINVIERCHHHILFSRIPDYQRNYLQKAQSESKTVFEYWTHALSYVPTKDYRYFMSRMKGYCQDPGYFKSVTKEELQKVLRRIKKEGALSIRDIEDDELVEKGHLWDSRKPSKKALQWGFHRGDLVISERRGMLKRYELLNRHFDWEDKPKAASEAEILDYKIERALRSQGIISLDSICYMDAKRKAGTQEKLEKRVHKEQLIPVKIEGIEKPSFWMAPELLEYKHEENDLVHILSPFDPLIIQRKRLKALFDYEHVFEAYIPKEKRKYGYFGLPVLIDNEIVAVLDLKTDREKEKLLIQKWTWLPRKKSPFLKRKIEEELSRFERFQLGL